MRYALGFVILIILFFMNLFNGNGKITPFSAFTGIVAFFAKLGLMWLLFWLLGWVR